MAEKPGRTQRSEQVRFERGLEFLNPGFEYPAGRIDEDGGIVDQDVGCTEPVANKIAQLLDAFRLGDIEEVIEYFAARILQALHCGEPFDLIPGGQDDPETQPGQLAADFEPQAPAGTGHNGGALHVFCFHQFSRRSRYFSANRAGCPPVCQNKIFSSFLKKPLRIRSIRPAAARPV